MRRWTPLAFLVLASCGSASRTPSVRATPAEDEPPVAEVRLADFLPEEGDWRGTPELEEALSIVEALLVQPRPEMDEEAMRPVPAAEAAAEYSTWVARRRITASRLPVLLWSDVSSRPPEPEPHPAAFALLGLALEDLPSPRAGNEWRGPGIGSASEAYRRCVSAARSRDMAAWQAFCERRLTEVVPEQALLGDCGRRVRLPAPTADVFVLRPRLDALFTPEERALQQAIRHRLSRLLSRSVELADSQHPAHPEAATALASARCPPESSRCTLDVVVDDHHGNAVTFAAPVRTPLRAESWRRAAQRLHWVDDDSAGTLLFAASSRDARIVNLRVWGSPVDASTLVEHLDDLIDALGCRIDDLPRRLEVLVELASDASVRRIEARDLWTEEPAECDQARASDWRRPGLEGARLSFGLSTGDRERYEVPIDDVPLPYIQAGSEPALAAGLSGTPEVQWRWEEDMRVCVHRYGELPEAIACLDIAEDGSVREARLRAIAKHRRPLERLRDPEPDTFPAAACVRDALRRLEWSEPLHPDGGEVRVLVGWHP